MTRPFPFLKGEVRAAMTNPAVKQRIHGDAKSTANTECATWLQLIRGQGTNPETPTFVLHLVTDTAKTFPSEAKLLTTDPFEIPDAEDKDKEVDPSILKNALKKKWEVSPT